MQTLTLTSSLNYYVVVTLRVNAYKCVHVPNAITTKVRRLTAVTGGWNVVIVDTSIQA